MPSASARRVSIVINKTFWPGMAWRSAWRPREPTREAPPPPRVPARAQATMATMKARPSRARPANAARRRRGETVTSVSRGARAGPRGLGERAARFRADGIGLLGIAEHRPQPRRERVGVRRRGDAGHVGEDTGGEVGAPGRLIEHRET